jgi:2-C-methyl-D-erythritol 4-phosphate cytidylyltransferase / 2-C-methyl-D-erythritol 2,4-cyclodiphosphate synthase
MKVVAAILAAGRGERFGRDKTQILLRGQPLWRWSFQAFARHPEVHAVGLVGSSENLHALRQEPGALFAVQGGNSRTESSRAALAAAPDACEILLLHDAARPFVSPRVISDVIAAARRAGAAAPGIPLVDTVKRKEGGRLETLDRAGLYRMQTPQAARLDVWRDAFAKARGDATDDLALVEDAGVVPEVVPGEEDNFKVTLPEDLERARRTLGGAEVRTGIGYDVHAFSRDPGRKLVLGGADFEGEPGLEGHSDADAVLHAAVDALLGAGGLGDIGVHFPNTDPRWKDEPSGTFLAHAAQLLKEAGWTVQNLDITVLAERPKVQHRSAEMRANLARRLQIAEERINLKATTNERLGFIGREEGIAALAIATISRFEP